MKYTRPIRSLLCGLGAALLLLTCLPASALAAEKSFTSMFPGYTESAGDPQAAEAVLAGMGTVIGQSQTVNGVTLTLDGAIWSEDKMLLSFSLDGANIPRDIPSGTRLSWSVMQVTLAEHQRETYVRSKLEETEKLLSGTRTPSTQEELDAKVRDALSRGEPELPCNPTLVRSGGKDRLLVYVSVFPYVEHPELAVHIGDLVLYKNAKGKYWPRPYEGYEPLTLVSGPFDFTFTAEKRMKPLVYTGAVDVTVQGIPARVRKVTVTAFDAEVEWETLQRLDLQNNYTRETQKLSPVRLNGVWTRDGLPLTGTELEVMGGGIFTPDPRLEKAWVTTSNTHPHVIDPAAVAAVDLGGVRVELSGLTLQENPPLQNIMIAPRYSGTEPEKKEEPMTPAQIAQAEAEREKKLEEAKKIAYQDLSTASREMQVKILEARKLIINSTSWVADGFDACVTDKDGKQVPVPHFSELFPGWEMPKA